MVIKTQKISQNFWSHKDFIALASLALTVLVLFVSWSRQDSAREQELADMKIQIQEVNTKVSTIQDKIDQVLLTMAGRRQ